MRAAPAAGHSGLGLATVERLVRAAQGTLAGRQIQGGFVVEATFTATDSPDEDTAPNEHRERGEQRRTAQ